MWVRIPRLPLELFNTQFLWRIGLGLGSMLKVDWLTSVHSRGQYARICVDIDLEKPLKSFILTRGHKLCLEYEGLHLICFHCGRYGHKFGQCDRVPEASKVLSPEPSQVMVNVNHEGTPNGAKDATNNANHAGSSTSIKEPLIQVSNKKPESNSSYGSWMIPASKRQRKNQKNKKEGDDMKNKGNSDVEGGINSNVDGSRFYALSENENAMLDAKAKNPNLNSKDKDIPSSSMPNSHPAANSSP